MHSIVDIVESLGYKYSEVSVERYKGGFRDKYGYIVKLPDGNIINIDEKGKYKYVSEVQKFTY